MSTIRFPRLHIAESVVNRILNAADEIEGGEAAGAPARKASQEGSSSGDGAAAAAAAAASGTPAADLVPDPTLAGGELDLALSGAIPPVAPDDRVMAGAATGQASPLEALLEPGAPV